MILGLARSHEGFAANVCEAIDERLGMPSSGWQGEFPLKDAPLFGQTVLIQSKNGQAEVDAVLPPRRQADHLTDIYWRFIQPSHLCLDKERFHRFYDALYTGICPQADERIFMSTLNLVFAFATQVQESLSAEQRTSTANTYFQRAWDLLRPECLLWEPGSPETVECLLLMSRYLQCFGDSHRTFMVLGSAMRMAQSIGLHLIVSLNNVDADDSRWRQRLWKCYCFTEM